MTTARSAPIAARAAPLLVALVAVALLLLTGCGAAPVVKDPTKRPQAVIPPAEALTAADILDADQPIGPFLSPDASAVMWIRAHYAPGEELPAWEMYVTDVATLERTKVVASSGLLAGLPKWAPDGTAFAYVAAAPEGTDQLFTVPATGGEPFQVTSVEGGVVAHAWRDASTLVFTASVPGKGAGGEDDAGGTDVSETTDDTIHVAQETDDKVRLFEVAASGGKPVQLTRNDDQITRFWLSPDGAVALTVQTKAANGGDLYYQEVPDATYLVDLSSGAGKRVLEDVRSVVDVAWSDDSTTVWVEDARTPDELLVATMTGLLALDARTGAATDADLGWARGIHSQSGASPALVPTAAGFITMLADGCNPKVAVYGAVAAAGSGTAAPVLSGEVLEGEHQGNIFALDVSADGKRMCYLYSTPSDPPQMYVADILDGAITGPRRLTDLNRGWAGREFVRHEVISWQGARGDPVEGILYYPSGYEPGRKYPLLLMIHGGPFHVDLAEWPSATGAIYPYQLMAQKGAFVLAPNYHGSSEYGLEFARSIRDGEFYDLPVEDVESAVSRLADLGMVDAERLGTLGWSNGSILSHALIARDQRFKAASCGAGGNEWVSLWGPGAEGYALMEYYFGASPMDDSGLYKDAAMAPFYKARDVQTPVVMYQGDADTNVPPGMTWVAYRGLQKYGKAPVELFIFPGEGHSPILRSHLKRKLTEDIAWFDRYLFAPRSESPTAPGSDD